MRSKRSDSGAAGSSSSTRHIETPYLDPNLEQESEESGHEMEDMNRTPEENKNPGGGRPPRIDIEKVIRVEKAASFSPPPALSPAYSIQEQVEVEEEPEELESEVKMEIDTDQDEVVVEEEKKTLKKEEIKVEQRPKMKYKKKAEKSKDAVPFIDPNAPKRNRSAYVHFIIHRRASYSKATMSQRDINIALAADWQKLTPDERIPFHKKAEEEKEKYTELMNVYKNTDSHHEFMKKRSKFLTCQQAAAKKQQRKRKRGDDSDDDNDGDDDRVQMAFPRPTVFCPLLNKQQDSSNATSSSSTSSTTIQYAGPIFTPEFMSYNKTRDSYRRQLAVERSNLEHELEALHQYDIDVRIQKQGDRIQTVDTKIDETMVKMRAIFNGVAGVKDHLNSIEALTDFLSTVTRLGPSNPIKKSIKEKINYHAKTIIALRK